MPIDIEVTGGIGRKFQFTLYYFPSRSTTTISSGRRDLRPAMVNTANRAVQHHVHWKCELERIQPHLGRSKAIARKLLFAIWHVLTKNVADHFADPPAVARSFRGGAAVACSRCWVALKKIEEEW
jgi:hypothetical protein